MKRFILSLNLLLATFAAMAQIDTSKEYRIKDTNTCKYLHAANYDEHAKGSTGGVNLVNYAMDDDMVFTFEASGNGYYLKTKSGYYIYCQEWNVDALSKKSLLIFSNTEDGNYNIMNGNLYFKVEQVSGGYYPFCNDNGSNKATWTLEEAIPLPTINVRAYIEGWNSNNPNTHLGALRTTDNKEEFTTQLNITSTANYKATYRNSDCIIDFTRNYRGFEFLGYRIGQQELGKSFTLTQELIKSITAENPLIAKFRTTNEVVIFYDDDAKSYRIPAIAKTGTNRLVTVSDYRHNLDDIGRDKHNTGTLQVDLVIRTSDDNGATWSAKQTIAEGSSDFGYGDAAIAANEQNILVMAVAGNVFYPWADADNHNKSYRIYSNDNGVTWNKEEITNKILGTSTSLFPDACAAFFGSGKLAVDPDFNGSGKARVYGAILLKNSRSDNNYVLYSDDWGANWKILGNSTTPIAYADEPKVEILPNGQILLSSRRNGGRIFNVFTYGSDKANGQGSWSNAINGCNNGGSNGTNGEIICVDAKRQDGTPVKLLLQSQPKGGSSTWDRKDVTIWYKEISGDTYTPSYIASDWNEGLQVSKQLSAYSAMTIQDDGKVGFFFEEAPCHQDNHEKGYCMVYIPLTIATITKGNYTASNNTSTNIENIDSTTLCNAIYDLSGRKVQNPTKGIYIVNGKKIKM